MKNLKDLWARIEGNKSIICLGLSAALTKAIELGLVHQTNVTDFIGWALLGLAGGAITHHIQKGYFNTDKGK